MVDYLIYFVVLVILFSAAWYAVETFVTSPQVKKMLSVLLVVMTAVVVCYGLLQITGVGPTAFPRLHR